MNINKVLTKPKLKKWLESKKPLSCVGKRGSSQACPIFEFLKSEGLPVTTVAAGSITLKKGSIALYYEDMNYVNPKAWVDNFINKVDAAPAKNITAKRALQILETL
jgi:hypothetical protein